MAECRRAACVVTLAGGLLAAMAATWAAAAAGDNPLLGIWLTENGASKVEIYPCGTALCGKIIEILDEPKDTDEPLLDSENEDPGLRDRPILGLRILEGFIREGERRWVDGQGYNPRDGRVYKGVEIELETDDRLKIGSCIIWGLICSTETWTRAKE
jgi:uncharacterized protein (DUF2147 family)